MYVYIYICLCIYVCVYIYIYIYIYIDTNRDDDLHGFHEEEDADCIHVCVCTCTYTCTHDCFHLMILNLEIDAPVRIKMLQVNHILFVYVRKKCLCVRSKKEYIYIWGCVFAQAYSVYIQSEIHAMNDKC
jgi:hypothetical protein